MSDTTCNYNKVHGVFNRQEIRMLAQALALPEARIDDRLNKLGIGETIQTTELLDLIEKGVFIIDFNYMYNARCGRYNSVVFVKALQLIDSHLFSFNEIFKARLAFNIYEINVSSNYKKNFELILQSIKFCDCHISILKLERRLLHYGLNSSRILHLSEYFDLLLICHRDNNNNSSKSFSTKTIDVADPKPIDQQMMEELDKNYLRDERNWFFQERFHKQKMTENPVWPAKIAHQYQTNIAAIRKAQIQRALSTSISSLKLTRTGSSCSSRSRIISSSLRQSAPVSFCSSTSFTTRVTPSRTCSRSQSTQSVREEIETIPSDTKSTEIKRNNISNRMKQLECDSAFLTIKYALYREDYMNELLPDGYTKPLIIPKPIERRLKKSRSSVHWARRANFT
ncbi:unnamed protein product [Rotaria socialis]|uniref:Uncharacterized protein n=1 Tax=Rotaria socialis TaxID=392032 RepID=A0A817KY58_9BILA|nr:unnamed protein product [Rotaria socialis]CAF4399090.1 unnamed protein product [Rotaria socialis]